MRINRPATGALTLIALLLASPAGRRPLAVDRAIVVTFDDLPATAAGVVANDVVGLEALTRKLLGAVQTYSVPAVGFVNEGKLFVEGAGRDEVITRPLMTAKGWRLRYFRHPFLHVGSDLPTRRAFETFLSRHGYTSRP